MGTVLILSTFLAGPHVLLAKDTDFAGLLRKTGPEARTIASDEEATASFLKTFGASLQLPKKLLQTARRQNHPAIPNGLTQHLSLFMANLATWHLTNDLLTALEQDETPTIQSTLDRRQRQIEWLKQTKSQPDLPDVLALVTTIAQLHPPEPVTQPLSPHYALFVQFLHERYPDWIGTPNSWLTLAQTEGPTGVRKRLQEYWDHPPARGQRLQADPASSINRFLQQSFLPTTVAYARAALLQLHVRNEQQAWMHWQATRQWNNDRKNEKGLRRLCGTWQWLIHNHQDHGDHKTIMVYPPPSQYHRMDPQPAVIQVRGDTVYVRWEFPRGIVQEESLLLSEKDQLLSGTFVNNLGPNGTITGRRVKPCREK